MRDNRDIEKIGEKLQSFEPVLHDREELIRDIMTSTGSNAMVDAFSHLLRLLFSWTDYPWVRMGMVTLSAAIIILFATQQVTIINRIDRLEGRMVESNTQQLLKHQGENVIMNSVLLHEVSGEETNDSTLVADKDLRALIDSYTALQKRYQDLQDDYHVRKGSKIKM